MLQTSLTTVQTDEREIRTEDTGDNERVEGKIHKPEIEVADSAEDRMWVGGSWERKANGEQDDVPNNLVNCN